MAIMMCCCCDASERGSGPHLLFVRGWREVVAGYMCPECVADPERRLKQWKETFGPVEVIALPGSRLKGGK